MSTPIIQIDQGRLKGKTGVDYKGNTFYMFQGIRYAKPPIGELRFKAPQPAEPWTGIFDATVEGSECISNHIMFQHEIGSEDCLNLNIYTPELPNDGPTKPVMVWIHGGYFSAGSNKKEVYGPEFLVSEDVVIVTINYRLGIFGFLSLEDTSLGVPGNAGLKDMVLALKWVQNNIKHFNGDPNNVTIFGESAGAGSCNLLMLSPKAKGLFHRVIMQSGASLCPWVFGTRNSYKLVELLGKSATNEEEALNILTSTPAMDFLKISPLVEQYDNVSERNIVRPVIEKPNPDAFITEHPMDIMLSGNYSKVPIIIGYNSLEGLIVDLNNKLAINRRTQYRLDDFQNAISYFYNLEKNSALSISIANLIEEFYYGFDQDPEGEENSFHTLNTDILFVRTIQITIKTLLKTLGQSIYVYKFNCETSLNLYKHMGKGTRSGACHFDDIGYLFKTIMTPDIKPNSDEDIAMRRMVKLWTNFAKTGNPNPKEEDPLINIKWPEITKDNFCYLNINKQLLIETNPDHRRMRFWDAISKKLNSRF